MNTANALIGFWLAIAAASATLIGWAIVAGRKKISEKAIGVALIIAALAMLYVSFTQLIPQAFDNDLSNIDLIIWLGLGFFIVVLLRYLGDSFSDLDSLKSSALLVAAAVTAHNLPEGAATIATTVQDLSAGITTSIAIAIHNIPEGLAIAAAALAAGFTKKKALIFVLVAAAAEMLGSLVVLVDVQVLNQLVIAKLQFRTKGEPTH